VHRGSGDAVDAAVEGIDLERFGTSEEIERQKVLARRELYWPLLIGVAGIAAWEVGAGVTALLQTRRRREARP
jgi:Ca-activated chloride channel family protein